MCVCVCINITSRKTADNRDFTVVNLLLSSKQPFIKLCITSIQYIFKQLSINNDLFCVSIQVFTTEGKAALIHKTSVNCNNAMTGAFESPFFVFAEKVFFSTQNKKLIFTIQQLEVQNLKNYYFKQHYKPLQRNSILAPMQSKNVLVLL